MTLEALYELINIERGEDNNENVGPNTKYQPNATEDGRTPWWITPLLCAISAIAVLLVFRK